jgi:hypothetical protein
LEVLQRYELALMMLLHSCLVDLALLLEIGQLRKRIVKIVLLLKGRWVTREEIR